MNTNRTPDVALCPCCFCPLDISQSYRVDFCLPARLPFPMGFPPTNFTLTNTPPMNVHTNQVPTTGTLAHSSPPSVPQQLGTPTSPYEPPTLPQPQEHDQDHVTHGASRCSSSSSYDLAFTQYSINADFAAELTAIETAHFSQRPFQASSPPLLLVSSPSSESSVTLPTIPTSSPSMELFLTPLASEDEPLFTARRWVVF